MSTVLFSEYLLRTLQKTNLLKISNLISHCSFPSYVNGRTKHTTKKIFNIFSKDEITTNPPPPFFLNNLLLRIMKDMTDNDENTASISSHSGTKKCRNEVVRVMFQIQPMTVMSTSKSSTLLIARDENLPYLREREYVNAFFFFFFYERE